MSGNRRLVPGLLLFFVLFSGVVQAQCCSTGSPVGASLYVGVLVKQSLRVVTFYRNNYADTYYTGTDKTTEDNQLKCSGYNFIGLALGYGITRRFTLETDLGYFINKTQVFKTIDYKETGYGMSNGGVTMKYAVFVRPKNQIELTLGAGFRYPFTTTPQEVDGVQLSRDVQPSTNAFALSGMVFFNKGFPSVKMRLFSINRYDHTFEDPLHYKYGDLLLNSVFVSRVIVKNLMAIVQVRSEYRWKDEDDGEKLPNTGNLLIIVAPQLNYAIGGKWNITGIFDIPVFKNYNGKQLTPKYSFAISLSRDFYLGKKAPVSVESSVRKQAE